MKKIYSLTFTLIIFSISLSISQAVLFAKQAKLNPKKSSVTFSITHLLVDKVTGNFDDFDFSLNLDKNTIKEFSGTVKTTSINTQNKKRDNHLRSDDFFDSENYPKITYKNTSYKKISDTKGILLGTFIMRGIKKKIDFNVSIKDSKKSISLILTTTINRKDFKVGTSFASKTLSEEVEIKITTEFQK